MLSFSPPCSDFAKRLLCLPRRSRWRGAERQIIAVAGVVAVAVAVAVHVPIVGAAGGVRRAKPPVDRRVNKPTKHSTEHNQCF